MCIKAYLHGKATVREACQVILNGKQLSSSINSGWILIICRPLFLCILLFQVIKEDILRSLWARCDMHCDSLIGEEQRGQPDGINTVLAAGSFILFKGGKIAHSYPLIHA